jgi:hypothetical protein
MNPYEVSHWIENIEFATGMPQLLRGPEFAFPQMT